MTIMAWQRKSRGSLRLLFLSWFLVLVLHWTALTPTLAADEKSAEIECDPGSSALEDNQAKMSIDDGNDNGSNEDDKDGEVDDPKKEALRRMVSAYARAEKASIKTVMADVKLLFQDTFPSQWLEDLLDDVTDGDPYADSLILNMLRTTQDLDCTEREFDVSFHGFDATDAAMVLHKCKMLVLRNVFDREFLDAYKGDFTAYIRGLHDGRISKTGKTTNGENFFINKLHAGRWEVLLPKALAPPDLLMDPEILQILRDERVLGEDMMLHSFGAAIADSKSKAQNWHIDSALLFDEYLYETAGISHHELPSYAITMLVPLLNMTLAHGPTDFCIGSSNLGGMNEDRKEVPLWNESLREHLYEQPDLEDTGGDDSDECDHIRTPLIGFGDVVLFDYQIIHRGGRNVSPDLRSILYMTYSRFWYKDKGFDDKEDMHEKGSEEDRISARGGNVSEKKVYERLTETARFALPDQLTEYELYKLTLLNDSGGLEDIGVFHGLE